MEKICTFSLQYGVVVSEFICFQINIPGVVLRFYHPCKFLWILFHIITF